MIGELGDSQASEGLDDCPSCPVDVCNLRPLHVRSCGVGRIGRIGHVGAAEEDADTPRGTHALGDGLEAREYASTRGHVRQRSITTQRRSNT